MGGDFLSSYDSYTPYDVLHHKHRGRKHLVHNNQHRRQHFFKEDLSLEDYSYYDYTDYDFLYSPYSQDEISKSFNREEDALDDIVRESEKKEEKIVSALYHSSKVKETKNQGRSNTSIESKANTSKDDPKQLKSPFTSYSPKSSIDESRAKLKSLDSMSPLNRSYGTLNEEERAHLLAKRYQLMRSQEQRTTSALLKAKHLQQQNQHGKDGSKEKKSDALSSIHTTQASTTNTIAHQGTNQLLNDKSALQTQKESLSTTMSSTTPWARKFILSRAKDSLLPIPREFLSDGFNLMQLPPIVERVVRNMLQMDISDSSITGTRRIHGVDRKESVVATKHNSHHHSLYKAALRLILDPNENQVFNNSTTVELKKGSDEKEGLSPTSHHSTEEVQKAAEVLYTLVHARYVTSPRGLDTIRRMFRGGGTKAIFGRCPRTRCKGMPLLPMGTSNDYDETCDGGCSTKAMRYCCSCGEAFYMWDSKVDGSAWGPSFCHLFLMTHGSEIFPWLTNKESKRSNQKQVEEDSFRPQPQIFGFKIHEAANIQYPML